MKPSSTFNTYVWKAMWRGTALTFRVEAPDEERALKKAKRVVKYMEGAECMMELKLMKVF